MWMKRELVGGRKGGQVGPGKERVWENLRPWRWFSQSGEARKNRHAECDRFQTRETRGILVERPESI